MRGRASADCTDNDCPRLAEPILLDEMDGEVVVIASWERIARVTPGYADSIYGGIGARISARAAAALFWVALGDTDEYAHCGDYSGYLTSLRAADRLIGELWPMIFAIMASSLNRAGCG